MKHQANQRSQCEVSNWGSRAVSVCELITVVLVGAVAIVVGATTAPAPPSNSDFQYNLNNSVYQPIVSRDPFLSRDENLALTGPKTVDTRTFHLDGFLGPANNLNAIVNGCVLSLNKPIVVKIATGHIQIKAVQITLEGVVLEVGGQHVKLKCDAAKALEKPPK